MPKDEEFVPVLLPFGGTASYPWSIALDSAQKDFTADVLYGDEDYRAQVAEALEHSPGWQHLLASIKDPEVAKIHYPDMGYQEFIDKAVGCAIGNRIWMHAEVPVDMEDIFEAQMNAVSALLCNTPLYNQVMLRVNAFYFDSYQPPKDPKEPGNILVNMRKDIFKEMRKFVVYNDKTYIEYAKYRSTPHSGYLPLVTYKEFFDHPVTLEYASALLLWWCALGCTNHYAATDAYMTNYKIDNDFKYTGQGFNIAKITEVVDHEAWTELWDSPRPELTKVQHISFDEP